MGYSIERYLLIRQASPRPALSLGCPKIIELSVGGVKARRYGVIHAYNYLACMRNQARLIPSSRGQCATARRKRGQCRRYVRCFAELQRSRKQNEVIIQRLSTLRHTPPATKIEEDGPAPPSCEGEGGLLADRRCCGELAPRPQKSHEMAWYCNIERTRDGGHGWL